MTSSIDPEAKDRAFAGYIRRNFLAGGASSAALPLVTGLVIAESAKA